MVAFRWLVLLFAACGGGGDSTPLDAPPVDSAPDAFVATCLHRDPSLDAACTANIPHDYAPFGFRCDDGAPKSDPTYPSDCFLFGAKFDDQGELVNLGAMCCTADAP